MKTNRVSLFIRGTILIVAILSATNFVSAQSERTTPAKFLILVETNSDEIKLTAETGCVFQQLSFKYNKQPQAINACGMTSLDPEIECNISTFLFVINKTEDGLSFKGVRGTAWKDLSFSCKKDECHQYIDQNGMTDIKK